MNVNLSEKALIAVLYSYDHIKEAAATFIAEENKRKKGDTHSVNAEDIEFDRFSKKILWSYEYNGACHCHPEMHTRTAEYSFDDFIKFLSLEGNKIEQFTEAEIDW